MHPSQIGFLTNERIGRIAREAKAERFRRGDEATEPGKVARLLAELLPSGLQGLTSPKPREQCC
jgi:hypothetical protein